MLSAIDPFALVVAHRRRKTVAPFLIPQRVPANARVALYSADNKQGFAPLVVEDINRTNIVNE